MQEFNSQVPDRGPWTVRADEALGVRLDSDDFHVDASLTISGDFGSYENKIQYAKYLSDILTQGCRRAMASQELTDEQGLLSELLAPLSHDPVSRELLHRAADEIARLRIELKFFESAFERMQVSQYGTRRVRAALEPSPFAQKLAQALKRPLPD